MEMIEKRKVAFSFISAKIIVTESASFAFHGLLGLKSINMHIYTSMICLAEW